jgi:phosphate/sulfate permease
MRWKAVKEIAFSWFFTPIRAGVVSFLLYMVLFWLIGAR